MTRKSLHLAVVGAAALLTAASAVGCPPGAAPAWWIGLLLGAGSILVLGALEPALVAVLSAAAGALWAHRLDAVLGAVSPAGGPAAGWAMGIAAALPLIRGRLARFRGQSETGYSRCGHCALAASAGLALWTGATRPAWTPFVVLPPLSALVLAPFGMNVLLFMDNRRGAPRLPWLVGAAFGLAYVMAVQILLLLFAVPVRLLPGDPLARLRRLGRLGPRTLFRLFPYGRLDTFGIEQRAFERPAIMISNHQSAVDVLLVLALPGDVRLTLSPRVWRTPTLGIAARSLGHVLVESGNPEATLETCAARLRENALVHFFPEGTRSEDAFPARFRRGAFDIAVALGCDVLPVLLCDTRTCVPRDAFWVERFHMSVKVLPRITPLNFDYGQGSRALRKHAQETVRAAFLEEHARINTPAVLRRKVARLYRYQGLATGIAVRRALAKERWMELMADVLPARGRVLDLGCGLGLASHWLAERHPRLEVVGTDRDPERIRVARRSAAGSPRVTFVCGPVEEIPGPWDGALLRAGAASDLDETLRRLLVSLGPAAPLFLPDLTEEQRGAVAAAGFLPAGEGPVYVRGPSA